MLFKKWVKRSRFMPAFALVAALLLAGCVDEDVYDEDRQGQNPQEHEALQADMNIRIWDHEFSPSDFRGIPVGHKIYFYNAGDEVHRPVQLQGGWDVGDIEPGTGTTLVVPDTGDTNQSFKCEYHGDAPHNMRATMFIE
jgi:hypothetical protein